MRLLTFLLLFVLVFVGVAGYELEKRGLLTRETLDLYMETEDEGEAEEAMAPVVEPVELAASIQAKKLELHEETERLQQMTERFEAQREELEGERTLLEQRVKELKAETGIGALTGEAEGGSPSVAALVKMYEGMPPEEAAAILDKLPDPIVARILLRMRKRQAAQALGSMDKNKAAEVTKLLSIDGGVTKPVTIESAEGL